MKANKILNLVIGTIFVTGIALTAVGAVYCYQNDIDIRNVFEGKYEKRSVSSKNITSLDLSTLSNHVEIKPSTTDELKIDYLLNVSEFGSINKKFDITFENGKAKFKEILTPQILNLNPIDVITKRKVINVYLPISVTNINISNVSGDTSCYDSFNFENASFKNVSGNNNLTNFTVSNTLNIENVSGKITSKNIKFSNAIIKSTSGLIELNNLEGDDLEASNVSGNIVGDNLKANSINLKNTSGKIEGKNLISDRIVSANTSGPTRLEVKGNEKDYKVSCNSTSGKISLKGQSLNLNGNKSLNWGDGDKSIISSSVSSEISITFKD